MEATVSVALLANDVNDLEPWSLDSGSSERWAGAKKWGRSMRCPHTTPPSGRTDGQTQCFMDPRSYTDERRESAANARGG
jgi:hypothetical protein